MKSIYKEIRCTLAEYIAHAKDSKRECYKLAIIMIILGVYLGG